MPGPTPVFFSAPRTRRDNARLLGVFFGDSRKKPPCGGHLPRCQRVAAGPRSMVNCGNALLCAFILRCLPCNSAKKTKNRRRTAPILAFSRERRAAPPVFPRFLALPLRSRVIPRRSRPVPAPWGNAGYLQCTTVRATGGWRRPPHRASKCGCSPRKPSPGRAANQPTVFSSASRAALTDYDLRGLPPHFPPACLTRQPTRLAPGTSGLLRR